MPIGYRLSRLSGRLIGASSRSAYNPQAFSAAQPIPVMRTTAAEKPAAIRSASSLSEPIAQIPAIPQTEIHGVYPSAEFYAGVLEKQRSMAPANDPNLVWQKRPLDKVLFNATVFLCAAGLLLMAQQLGGWAYGVKPKKD